MSKVAEIKEGSWIFTKTQFGEKAYKVLGVRTIAGGAGAEVKTHYGDATFSVMLGADNWRFAVQSDL